MTTGKNHDPGAALDALIAANAKKSTARRLREHFEKITEAINAGVPQAEIIQALQANGLHVSAGSFRTYLYRERVRRGLAGKKFEIAGHAAPQAAKPKEQETPRAASDTKKQAAVSTDPRDIDKIINSTPDLESYAKLYQAQKGKDAK